MVYALSISRPLAKVLHPGAEGVVHSVFERACNLLISGRLAGVVAPALGNGPDAVVAAPPSGGFAASPHWQPGTRFRVDDGWLLLGGGTGPDGSRLPSGSALRLAGATLWEPEPARPVATGDPAVGAAALGRSLAALGPRGSIWEQVLSVWDGRPSPGGALALAEPRIAALKAACLGSDRDAARISAVRLIGLGPGLTPAGDDFLAGLTATLLRAARWGMASGPISEALADLLSDRSRVKTTLPAETMLASAARGWLGEAASDVATGLLGGTDRALARFPDLLATGHTSGADTAAGIYMALRLLAAG